MMDIKQALVSKRLKLNKSSEEIKRFIHQEKINEAHLIEVSSLFIDEYFEPWLATEMAQLELCQHVAKRALTVRQTKAVVTKWKDFVKLASSLCLQLSDQWQPKFVRLFAGVKL